MEVDLGQLDLASQVLLREVRAVIRPIHVAAEYHDLTVEAVLPEAERRGVASPSSTHDHYTSRSHEHPPEISSRQHLSRPPSAHTKIFMPPPAARSAHLEAAAAGAVGASRHDIPNQTS